MFWTFTVSPGFTPGILNWKFWIRIVFPEAESGRVVEDEGEDFLLLLHAASPKARSERMCEPYGPHQTATTIRAGLRVSPQP